MPQQSERRVWRTRRALRATIAVLVWVPACLAAAWWQVHVALSGDSLGWVYSIEWPIFAAFGVYLWWFVVHDDPKDANRRHVLRGAHRESLGQRVEPAQRRVVEQEDEELRAYNDYLATLREGEQDKAFRLRQRRQSAR